jgi:hypothetical protein
MSRRLKERHPPLMADQSAGLAGRPPPCRALCRIILHLGGRSCRVTRSEAAKLLSSDFISADRFGVTATARRYLALLIVGEAYPPFRNGLPDYVKLANRPVPNKPNTQFAV